MRDSSHRYGTFLVPRARVSSLDLSRSYGTLSVVQSCIIHNALISVISAMFLGNFGDAREMGGGIWCYYDNQGIFWCESRVFRLSVRKCDRDLQVNRLYTIDTKALGYMLMNCDDYQKPATARYNLSRLLGTGKRDLDVWFFALTYIFFPL
jgi:hypothetical protein